jgi:hypothetical protein
MISDEVFSVLRQGLRFASFPTPEIREATFSLLKEIEKDAFENEDYESSSDTDAAVANLVDLISPDVEDERDIDDDDEIEEEPSHTLEDDRDVNDTDDNDEDEDDNDFNRDGDDDSDGDDNDSDSDVEARNEDDENEDEAPHTETTEEPQEQATQ